MRIALIEDMSHAPEPSHRSTMYIVLALAHYLGQNRGAADTQQGIARWWLGNAVDQAALAKALNWMARQGVLQANESIDGHIRYRLADGVDADELEFRLKARLTDVNGVLH